MNCPHFSRSRDKGQGVCAKGHYSGKPFIGNCAECQHRGWDKQPVVFKNKKT